jgi:hypothetical protein
MEVKSVKGDISLMTQALEPENALGERVKGGRRKMRKSTLPTLRSTTLPTMRRTARTGGRSGTFTGSSSGCGSGRGTRYGGDALNMQDGARTRAGALGNGGRLEKRTSIKKATNVL